MIETENEKYVPSGGNVWRLDIMVNGLLALCGSTFMTNETNKITNE